MVTNWLSSPVQDTAGGNIAEGSRGDELLRERGLKVTGVWGGDLSKG